MFNHMSVCFMFLFCLSFRTTMSKFADIRTEGLLRAEVQSCRGCSLNRLSEVKSFIYDDLPKYNWASFNPIPGASPDLVLFSTANKEVGRIALSSLTRRECNNLMAKYADKIVKSIPKAAKKKSEL
ncbi:selenoprotein M-like [Lycorma delicatula]|uniref:selenoprotein M-like n=1 Tax=Lycorma delicatula TaxID=130591 RepID=UPI003F519310